MTLPPRMMQISFENSGGPEVIRVGEADVPRPGPGQVLIAVAAAGLNRPDIMQRAGAYPPPRGESAIPGLEVSGTIAVIGSGVTGWTVGDAVCALLGSGGYADFAVADADLCLPKPAALDLTEAGGLPETAFTVWDNLFTRGRLAAGERVLIHGGSSGIGTMAIQLAKAIGAEVFTTAGTDDKCAFCRTLGADHAINYREADFAASVKQLTGRAGVDVILDMVGGDYVGRNLACLAADGRLVQIAFLGGAVAHEVDLTPLLVRRLTMTGSTMRARSLAAKAAVARAVREHVWPLIEAGRVKPIVHATFPLSQARAAQELMEGSTHRGKVLLIPDAHASASTATGSGAAGSAST